MMSVENVMKIIIDEYPSIFQHGLMKISYELWITVSQRHRILKFSLAIESWKY